MRRAESALTAHLDKIAEEIAAERLENHHGKEELDYRADEVRRQAEHLEKLKADVEARESEWEKLSERSLQQFKAIEEQILHRETELERRSQEIAKDQAALEELQTQVRRERADLNDAREQWERARREASARNDQAGEDRHEIDARLAETTAKLHAAEERSVALNADLHVTKEELQSTSAELKKKERSEMDLRAELEAVKAHDASVVEHEKNELARLRQDLADSSSLLTLSRKCEQEFAAELHNVEELNRNQAKELKAARQREEALKTELEELRERCVSIESAPAATAPVTPSLQEEVERLRQKLVEAEAMLRARPASANDETEAEMAALQLELVETYRHADEMQAQLTDTQTQLLQTKAQLVAAQEELAQMRSESSSDNLSEDDQENYRRRYEMALDDLKDLKTKNAELQQQLSNAPASGGSGGAVVKGILNWEAEKRRILAALESDFQDEEAEPDRIKIEQVIQKTEMAISDKDREIIELRSLLENQSNNLGQVAVGAAALGQALDADLVIQEERENLKRIQEEWREKLRQAEVELSIERAKIARDRLQLEERFHQWENEHPGGAAAGVASTTPSQATSKTTKSRWLERLGLGEGDKERGK